MFYIITSVQRSLKTTKLYAASSPEATAAAHALIATMPGAPTFIGSHRYESLGGLNVCLIQQWDTQASYDAWYAANGVAYAAARAAYNADNAISYVELPVTTEVDLFV
jgi:heme-degrading monooxygenase HmoA